MIRHIATMINGQGMETDVYYNASTKQVYQAEHPSRIDRELFTANSILEAEATLEELYGSNVDLD